MGFGGLVPANICDCDGGGSGGCLLFRFEFGGSFVELLGPARGRERKDLFASWTLLDLRLFPVAVVGAGPLVVILSSAPAFSFLVPFVLVFGAGAGAMLLAGVDNVEAYVAADCIYSSFKGTKT